MFPVKIPLRFIVFCILCVASMMSFISRGNMSILILAMTNPLNASVELPNYGKRYDWSAHEQSLVIGSYYWGQVLITLLSGVFCEKYGPKKIAGISFAIGAVLSALTPFVAGYVWIVISIRFFFGLAIGATPPALQAVISNWAPPDELGKFQCVYMAGGIGLVIDWCMSGFIIHHLGWTYSFYATAVLLGSFSIVWFSIIYETPSDHPKISTAEREYILSKLNATPTKTKSWPPFKSILSSVPVWALVCFHFGNVYPMYLFLTSTPKYFSDVHHMDIATVGLVSSIPQLLRFPFSLLFGVFGDYVIKRQMMSVAVARKLFSIITHILPAAFFVALPLFGRQPFVCVTFMTISLGLSSAISITSIANTHDISPNFATTIFSWMQSIGLTTGFIVPLVVTHFTKERSSNEEWGYVFLTGAVISVMSAIIFILFGSGQVQKWNSVEIVKETSLDVKAVPNKFSYKGYPFDNAHSIGDTSGVGR